MRSLPAFIAVAAAVTLSPGPAFALLLQVSAREGWRPGVATIAGNSVGVFAWGALSAVGVSALVAANRVAYDVLHLGGALFLCWLGARALLARAEYREAAVPTPAPPAAASIRRAARKGLVNSLANPKLAVFFVSLFPQFLRPGAAVLPAALAMAGVIVAFDLIWYSTVAVAVDRLGRGLAPWLRKSLQRVTGAVLLGFGVRLATEAA